MRSQLVYGNITVLKSASAGFRIRTDAEVTVITCRHVPSGFRSCADARHSHSLQLVHEFGYDNCLNYEFPAAPDIIVLKRTTKGGERVPKSGRTANQRSSRDKRRIHLLIK
jgi:hypothetical protein